MAGEKHKKINKFTMLELIDLLEISNDYITKQNELSKDLSNGVYNLCLARRDSSRNVLSIDNIRFDIVPSVKVIRNKNGEYSLLQCNGNGIQLFSGLPTLPLRNSRRHFIAALDKILFMSTEIKKIH